MFSDAHPSREELLQRLEAAEAELARLRAGKALTSPCSQAATIAQPTAPGISCCFSSLLNHHAAVCLLIDPTSCAIVDANPAAASHRWSLEELHS